MLYNIARAMGRRAAARARRAARPCCREVRASSEVYGETAAGLFDAPIPIAGIAGDQQAALFGQNCFEPGLAKNTYGTGCFMLMNIGREPVASQHQLLTTVAWQRRRRDGLRARGQRVHRRRGGAVAARRAGHHRVVRARSRRWPPRCPTPAASTSCRPSPAWARRTGTSTRAALIAGLTRGTTAAHIARAALEGIAFQVADVLDVMKADSGVALGRAARGRRGVAPTTC